MAKFTKGNPGRKKGSTNKLNRTIKESVLSVFNKLQKDRKHSLTAFAKKYPRDFYNIAAKLIPLEIKGNIESNSTITWNETKTYAPDNKTDSGT